MNVTDVNYSAPCQWADGGGEGLLIPTSGYPPTPSAVERAGTLNDIILTLQQTGIMDLEQATQVS